MFRNVSIIFADWKSLSFAYLKIACENRPVQHKTWKCSSIAVSEIRPPDQVTLELDFLDFVIILVSQLR